LFDEFGDGLGVIGSELRSFGGREKFKGPAVTIKCFEDNSLIKRVVETAGMGRVLVVDGGGSRRCALLGDMLAKAAATNGWHGIIVDGCVRDSLELRSVDIGIKARGTSPRKSCKFGEGQSDLQISIAGTAIKPGDMIYADTDGIVIMSGGPSILKFGE
jgi:regulator of ribonuclease activity A